MSPSPVSVLPPSATVRGYTSIYFEENQLSPSLVSLSPLFTGHRMTFQRQLVRASTKCYLRFTLPINSSLGFGFTECDSNRPIKTRFRYGYTSLRFNLATPSNSPAHYAKGTRSPIALAGHRATTACRHTDSCSFHSPNRGSFHLSLTVLVHYRSPGSI
jgi:hypothetical protein